MNGTADRADEAARRVAVVVNPERATLADEVTADLTAAGFEVTTLRPDGPDAMAAAARDASEAGATVVAAVGGDGTQRSVAAALAGTGTALAVVPGGTVNLFARVLEIHDVTQAVDAIGSGRRRSVDLGRCDGEPFVLNSSSGYDADVIERVDDGAKRFGRLGYTLVGACELVRRRAGRVAVTLDGGPWFSGRALTVLVLNVGQRGSEHLVLAPDAAPDDELLDVVVVRDRSVREVARALWRTVRGREPDRASVVTGQAAAVDVTWARPVATQRDGDGTGRARRLRYWVDAGAVTVCVPRDGPSAGRGGSGGGRSGR